MLTKLHSCTTVFYTTSYSFNEAVLTFFGQKSTILDPGSSVVNSLEDLNLLTPPTAWPVSQRLVLNLVFLSGRELLFWLRHIFWSDRSLCDFVD